MSSTALEDFDTRVARPHLTWRLPAYVRLLRRAASRIHARRKMAAEMRDPLWRAEGGVPPATEGKGPRVLAMGLWPFGS